VETTRLELTPKQSEFYNLVTAESVPNASYIGGLGSGKTVVGTANVLSFAQQYPGIRGLLLAPTYDQLVQGALQTFMEWCPPNYIKSHNRQEKIIQFNFFDEKGHPSEMLYRSTSEIDRIRSHEYAYVWWDEQAMSPEGSLQVVRGRLRHKRGVPSNWHYPIFGTTTPRGRNWLYRAFGGERMPNETDAAYKNRMSRFEMVHATTYDNQQNLPADYIDLQELAIQGDEQLRQQEIEGLFVSFEGLVYPQFNEELHVRHSDPCPWDSPQLIKRIAGVDFGGGDPSAIVFLGQGKSGAWHQFGEKVWTRPVGDVEMGEELHQWNSLARLDNVWCDPSNQTAIATFKASGLPAGPEVVSRHAAQGALALSARAINDREQGIRLVGELLSRRVFSINSSCTNSIAEFYSYLFKTQVDGEGNQYRTNTPIDHHADCMDARRYGLMGSMTYKGMTRPGDRGTRKGKGKGRRIYRRRRVAA
jgi:hypothetical protein